MQMPKRHHSVHARLESAFDRSGGAIDDKRSQAAHDYFVLSRPLTRAPAEGNQMQSILKRYQSNLLALALLYWPFWHWIT
jgi:hypothetical protein